MRLSEGLARGMPASCLLFTSRFYLNQIAPSGQGPTFTLLDSPAAAVQIGAAAARFFAWRGAPARSCGL
jgi:hypothetical protein